MNSRAPLISLLCFVLGNLGCGNANEAQSTAKSVAPHDDLKKIQEAILKAGYKNAPVAVFDSDDKTWKVVLAVDDAGPNGGQQVGGGRPVPERVLVSKGDFKVTRFANFNASRQPEGPRLEGREKARE